MSDKIPKSSFDEAMAVGRIKSALDGIMNALERGAKRGAAERRTLWIMISNESRIRFDEISAGVKPRAPKSAKAPAAQQKFPTVPCSGEPITRKELEA